MLDRYYSREPESIDDQLDELLCEYVDGTMDKIVREAFEEYLDMNPELAAHVRCLRETRNLLCHVGACRCASAGMQIQLRLRLANELESRDRAAMVLSNRLGNFAAVTSAVGLMLILGMMAGLLVVHNTTVDGTEDVVIQAESMIAGMVIASDAHGAVNRPFSRALLKGMSRSGFLGPISALPVISRRGAMTPTYWPWETTYPARKQFNVITASIAP